MAQSDPEQPNGEICQTGDKSVQEIQLSPEQIQQVETMSGLGLRVEDMAAVLGISTRTMHRRLADTSDVAAARARGRAIANMNVSRKAYEMATKGNVHLIKFWLATQADWKEKHAHEHSGKDGGPIQVQPVAAMTAEELAKQTAELMAERELLDQE